MAVGQRATVEGEGAVPFQPLHIPAAWTAPQALAAAAEWQYELTPTDVEEILAAIKLAVATGKPVPDLQASDFPLTTLGPRLVSFRGDVLHGIGFKVLRGFPLDRLTQAESVVGFYCLGLHIGEPRSQNAKGHVVGHVKDLGLDPDDDGVRVYATKAAQPWHVDDTDIVGLLCLKTAKTGGRSGWASSVSIYNRLLQTRPDLVEELAKLYTCDRKGEEDPGDLPYWEFPVLSWHKGYLTFFYNPRMIREAQRFPEVPRLTPRQLEALQAVTDLANTPELHLEWDLRPGDIQLLHNWNQLHMRTAYEDHPRFENRRHLLRLWLATQDSRPADPAVFGPSPRLPRFGIYKATTKHTAPLDAE